MGRNQELVREFHQFFEQPNRTTPTCPLPDGEVELRRSLLSEEAAEADEAMDNNTDLAHIAKELADVLVVTYGAAVHYGIDLDKAFTVVMESNMSKLWECEKCRRVPASKKSAVAHVWGLGKRPQYRADGKVLKPPTYGISGSGVCLWVRQSSSTVPSKNV
jgi:predicted HAD superfamily Cof-like phosphohydrolase